MSTTPKSKAEALRIAADALAAGHPVPPAEARWLADGLRFYLNHEGSSLDAALLLKPERGGAHRTLWAEARRSERERLLRDLVATLGGPSWSAAEQIAEWLAANTRERARMTTEQQVTLLRELARLDMPKSADQIWRTIRKFP